MLYRWVISTAQQKVTTRMKIDASDVEDVLQVFINTSELKFVDQALLEAGKLAYIDFALRTLGLQTRVVVEVDGEILGARGDLRQQRVEVDIVDRLGMIRVSFHHWLQVAHLVHRVRARRARARLALHGKDVAQFAHVEHLHGVVGAARRQVLAWRRTMLKPTIVDEES